MHLLYRDVERVARTPDLHTLVDTLETDIRFYIAEYAKRRVFVHAGVVSWKGRAILIPGRSFSVRRDWWQSWSGRAPLTIPTSMPCWMRAAECIRS